MNAKFALELLLGPDISLLQKHIEILKAVDETKSITKAAQNVGISYKNCWDSLNLINNTSTKPLIIRANGNKKNSGSELSEYGKTLIKTYEIIDNAGTAFLDEILKFDDISSENLLNLRKIGMKLSARNQLLLEISDIQKSALSAIITTKFSNGDTLSSKITLQSCENLALEVGKEVFFVFKAPNVKLSLENKNSSNSIRGVITQEQIGMNSAEICIEIENYKSITSIISKDEAMELKLGVGDEVFAIIDPSDIIIGA